MKHKVKKLSRPRARPVDPDTRKALSESLAVPVSVASLALGTGEYSVYQGVRDGSIPSIRVGRKILVPTAGLRRLLDIEDQTPA